MLSFIEFVKTLTQAPWKQLLPKDVLSALPIQIIKHNLLYGEFSNEPLIRAHEELDHKEASSQVAGMNKRASKLLVALVRR
jgi:hypothetical protein